MNKELDETQLLYKECKEKLEKMSNQELINSFNNDVGNPGWVSARARFHIALHEEFENRGFDYSAIGDENGLSFSNKITLVGKKIVIDDTKQTLSFALDTKDAEGYYHTYLINETGSHFTSIALESGGFYSDDEGVYPTKTVKIELNNIQPYSYKSVDRIDYMELELNISYQLECVDEHGVISHYEISLPKGLPEEDNEVIPFLEKKGWQFNLTQISKPDKKIVYIDMDNVLVDFKTGIARLPKETVEKYGDDLDDVPGIFSMMDPMPGAIEAFNRIAEKYDTYILSTAPWENPLALSDKVIWVKRYLGDIAKKRLIISHHKNLNRGDYLIDDRTRHGASEFVGEHIHFGTEKFPDWESVLKYLNA